MAIFNSKLLVYQGVYDSYEDGGVPIDNWDAKMISYNTLEKRGMHLEAKSRK